jgi:hypothetical protein
VRGVFRFESLAVIEGARRVLARRRLNDGAEVVDHRP